MVKLERIAFAIIVGALVAGFIYAFDLDRFVVSLFGGH